MRLWSSVIVGGILIIASFLWTWRNDRAAKERAKRHMEGRPKLTHDEFGREFFAPELARVASKVREIVADHIPVDLAQAQPADRVVEDLRMDDLDSMAALELVLDLEKKFDITISDEDAQRCLRIDDIVRCVAKELGVKSRPANGTGCDHLS